MAQRWRGGAPDRVPVPFRVGCLRTGIGPVPNDAATPRSGGPVQAEEPRPRPSRAGHLAGDHRQRPPDPLLPEEPAVYDENLVGLPTPTSNDAGARLQVD